MTTIADLLLDRLIGWGVDTIFSLPGDDINGIYEALQQGVTGHTRHICITRKNPRFEE